MLDKRIIDSKSIMFVNFFLETRRRGVLPVLGAYAIAGWVVVQVLSVIPQAIGLPDWLLTLATVLYLAFFPVVMFVSWYFDVSAEGFKLTPSVGQTSSTKIGKKYWLGFSMTLIFSTFLGVYGYQVAVSKINDPLVDLRNQNMGQSIAVLPFKDASPESNQQYLAFGIQEEISNKLGTFVGLSVASTFSTSAFFEKYSDPVVIASKLKVANILTGSIRVNGDRLKVRVELLNGANGVVIWTKSFTRQLIDIFAIEEEISRSIVNLLQDKYLKPGDVTITSKTGSSLALVLYLQARDSLRLRTTESIMEARKLFEQTLALDSEYANAKVGLAKTYLLLAKGGRTFGVIDTEVATRLARQNLTTVLKRYPELPDAHATMGLVYANGLEHEKAIVSFDQAIALNPNYATAYIWKYESLNALQRKAEAYEVLVKAFELDPAYLLVAYNYARYQFQLGRIDQARKLYDEIVELHPESPLSHRGLAEIAFSQGDLLTTAIEWRRALEKSPKSDAYRISLISVLLQVQAPEIAKQFIQNDDWDVNLLIAADRFTDVHALMDTKLQANPGDKWYLYEAAWYRYLYGDVTEGKNLLITAEPLFAHQELFLPPLCNPAMEIAYAHILNDDIAQSKILLDGCKKLLSSMVDAGEKSEAMDYLSARIAVLENNYPLAISKLQNAFDSGWREHWTKYDPLLTPIKQDATVQVIFAGITDELATAKTAIAAHFTE
jgi:TolB-like protein